MMQNKILGTVVITGVMATTSLGAEFKQPQWWEITTGILAIPAAIIGLTYSYLLIRKTKLESRKIELEILEKETAIESLNNRTDLAERVRPIVESRVIQLLFLRGLVLFLILKFWGLVESVYGFVTGAAFVGIMQITKLHDERLWFAIPFMIVQKFPEIVYWIIVISIGLPLFRDTNKFVGINLRELFRVRGVKSKKQNK